MTVKAYGAYAADEPLESLDITRRAPGAHDVQIDIAFCGVCHSDLHTVRAEWAGTQFPCVPGHEIVGHVTAVGNHVKTHKLGDLVGVDEIDAAYERMLKGDVKYRFVIDSATLAA